MGQIKGMIVSGREEGASFTELDWVKEQCLEKLGFQPYAGTLNLKVTKEEASLVKALVREEGISLLSPTPDFCHALCRKIKIGQIEGAVILPLVASYYEDIVEILAPVKVKESLNLKEGDEVIFNLEERSPA